MARFEMSDAQIGFMGKSGPSVESLFDLGIIYATGRDVAPDMVAAHKWFNLAAQQGDAEAAIRRQEIAQEMSPRDIAEAQRAAREWLRTH